MEFSDISLIAVAAAALIVVAVLAVVLGRLSSERSRIGAELKPDRGESLEAAAGRLAEAAGLAGELLDFKNSFDHLLAHCPLPVLLLDEDLIIKNLSHKAETELDQPRIRRGLLEGLESHELEIAVRQSIESMKPVKMTVRLYASGRRSYHARIFPFQTGDKHMCLVYLQSAASTVEFGELRSQFAATVSHELRTPLAGIRAMAETLKDPKIGPGDRDHFLERIDRETNRLGQLVDEILFLSSLESGATNLEGSSDLLQLTESLMEKLGPQAEQFEVRIKGSVPEGLAVNLPERMASIVISNLLENAIRYSGRGSHVEVNAFREGNQVKLRVSDDGIGIDGEHLPHIFERFYRVDKSRSRRLGGTGLGLSIVKHIVESAGGEIKVSSQEGFGTEFTVLLPESAA
ncbi:MAG: ATP-binding protein [Actinobacteria bacterium]|nr:ATP-binding protein [Actinomycetota bacterium]